MRAATSLRLMFAVLLAAIVFALAACETITGGDPSPCKLVRADTTWHPVEGGDSIRVIVEQYCREVLR